MRKLIRKLTSVLLVVLLLLPLSAFASEAEAPVGLQNVSLLGTAYASSIKHPDWTPAKSINDGLEDDWHGWEPLYPGTPAGATGLSGEYCGIDFGDTFYEISGAFMELRYADTQDITYTIQALILGEWIDVYVLHDHDYVGETRGNGAIFTLECTFDAPVTTNNIRILCSNYAKGFQGGDELLFPYIRELKLYGKEGVTPPVIIPVGESLTANIALTGEVTASSAATNRWPALIIDNGARPDPWMAAADDTDASVGVILADITEATGVSLDFGTDAAKIPFSLEVTYETGVKATVHTGTVSDGVTTIPFAEALCITEVTVKYEGAGAQLKELVVTSDLTLEDSNAETPLILELASPDIPEAVTLTFGEDTAAVPYKVLATPYGTTKSVELGSGVAEAGTVTVSAEALSSALTFITQVEVVFEGEGGVLSHMSVAANNRTLYRTVEYSEAYMQSAAKGNLAVLGTPYAESNFPDYSKIEYINDGLFSSSDDSWYANGSSVPTYCGVKLDKVYPINKVDLTFHFQNPKGSNVMTIEIQALVDGEYVTVASGYSYSPSADYKPVYGFETVETDDIRIVFLANGGLIFPNVREIEIYSPTEVPVAYMGYPTGPYPVGGRQVTTDMEAPTNDNLTYDTTVRDSNPPMVGGETTPADTTPADTAPADTTPADTTPTDTSEVQTTPADTTGTTDPTPGPAEPSGSNAWIVVLIVFVVCGGAVTAYLLIKRKKS